MPHEQNVDISKFSILLDPKDYQAIGTAITVISRLEGLLAGVLLTYEFGVGTPPDELKHRHIMQAMMKKSFRKRAERLLTIVMEKTGSEESRNHIEEVLDAVIKWRDFLCHATIGKLPDGRLHGDFWDRMSFDTDRGHIVRTFEAKDLYQLATSVLELSKWLIEEFEIERDARERLAGKKS